MPARARIEVLVTASIPERIWDEIWELTRTYYETERAFAEGKLRESERIALFRSGTDQSLVGMASLDTHAIEFRERPLVAIFTSHVLLREDHRGQNLVQRLGFRTFLEMRLRHPFRRIYWFFDTFSYKSYLLLARNLRSFWPRCESITPDWEQALIESLAGQIYGDAWQASRGVVIRSGRKRLRCGTAPIDPALATNPDFQFFVQRNPGHAAGDMLVCLCPLTVRNWLGIATRALSRARRRSTLIAQPIREM